MSHSVDDVLSCLEKYDEAHQDFHQRHAEVLAAKLHTAFQNITNAQKTPTSPALELTPTSRPRRRSTPKGEALCEFRRDAGKKTAQESRNNAQQTTHPRGGTSTHSPPTTSLRGRKTAKGLHHTGSLRTYQRKARPKRLSARAPPRRGYTCSKRQKRNKALHDTLRSYGIKEIAVLAI